MSATRSDITFAQLCPACRKPMVLVRAILRGPAPGAEVLECRACGVVATQPIEGMGQAHRCAQGHLH
jgi:hypothetical protein